MDLPTRDSRFSVEGGTSRPGRSDQGRLRLSATEPSPPEQVPPCPKTSTDETFRRAPRGLVLHFHALQSARRSLDHEAPAAEATARRLARALAADSRVQGFPEISGPAEAINDVSADGLGTALETLLAAVGDVLAKSADDEDVVMLVQGEGTGHDLNRLLDVPGRRVIRCNSASEAEVTLAGGRVDLVLLDLELPDVDGREFLVRHFERTRGIHLPLFVVSGDDSTLTKLECLALGATAFFGVPFDGAVLAARVSRAIEKSRSRKSVNRYDPVTGLGNRQAFAEAFAEIMTTGNGNRPPVTLGVLELFHEDGPAGAAMLRQDLIRDAGRLLNQALAGDAVISRLAGNELGLLLPGLAPAKAKEMLLSARREIEGLTAPSTGADSVRLSLRGGLVEAGKDATLADVMTEADRRLQSARGGDDSGLVVNSPERAGPRRILLTEDDRLMAKLTVHRLEHEGYRVFHFADGAEALGMADQVHPELMVLDVNMPGLDGMALLEHFRSQSTWDDVPILMLTAMSRDGDKVRAFDLGANDYLTKPFSTAELVARVGHLLAGRNQHAA